MCVFNIKLVQGDFPVIPVILVELLCSQKSDILAVVHIQV